MKYDPTYSDRRHHQIGHAHNPGHFVRCDDAMRVGLGLLGILLTGACALTGRVAGPGPTSTPTSTRTPVPTFTHTLTLQPKPTYTLIPTPSPSATSPPANPPPTPTLIPTSTPTVPPAPTSTPPPTVAPTPTETAVPTVTPTPEPVILYVLASTQREFNCDYTYIYGTVQDANGKGIPGVTVRALGIHETTGLDFTTQTDAQGRYEVFRFPLAELQVGQWAVILMSAGGEVSERFHWASTPVCQSSDLGHSQVLRVDWKLIE